MTPVDPPLIAQLRHLLGAHEEARICAAERDAAEAAHTKTQEELVAARAKIAELHEQLGDSCPARDWLKLRREHDAMQGERDAARQQLRDLQKSLDAVVEHRDRLGRDLHHAQTSEHRLNEALAKCEKLGREAATARYEQARADENLNVLRRRDSELTIKISDLTRERDRLDQVLQTIRGMIK